MGEFMSSMSEPVSESFVDAALTVHRRIFSDEKALDSLLHCDATLSKKG